MSHEAAAVDARTGDLYLTEDNGPLSGFYRMRPSTRPHAPGDLEVGGTLEMLRVIGQDNADLGYDLTVPIGMAGAVGTRRVCSSTPSRSPVSDRQPSRATAR